jgi:hypothetical protein
MTREEVMLYEVASSPLAPLFGAFNYVWVHRLVAWYFAMKVSAKWGRYVAYAQRQQ